MGENNFLALVLVTAVNKFPVSRVAFKTQLMLTSVRRVSYATQDRPLKQCKWAISRGEKAIFCPFSDTMEQRTCFNLPPTLFTSSLKAPMISETVSRSSFMTA